MRCSSFILDSLNYIYKLYQQVHPNYNRCVNVAPHKIKSIFSNKEYEKLKKIKANCRQYTNVYNKNNKIPLLVIKLKLIKISSQNRNIK